MYIAFFKKKHEKMAFNPAWIAAGASAAGALYTMFGGGTNRQMNNSEELMDYQYNLNNKAMREQEAAQLRMFENTGYAARVDQMKRAGLNPALIYGAGASGGGGVTGNISAPSVSGQQAPNQASFEANKLTIMGMGLQLAKLKSEIQVNESIAASNMANVPKSGSETELNISKKEGQDLENQMKQVNLDIKLAVKNKEIDKITALCDQAVTDLNTSLYKNASQRIQSQIDLETAPIKVKQFKENLEKTRAEIINLSTDSQEKAQAIKESLNRIEQNWIGKQIDVLQIKAELRKTLMNNETQLDVAEIHALTQLTSAMIQGFAISKLKKGDYEIGKDNTIPVPKPNWQSTPSR